MCLILFYWNPQEENSSISTRDTPFMNYKLILVANRDEYYDRKTKICHFWEDHNSYILAGKDLVGGGTWLGCSKDGKIAILTNHRIAFEQMRVDAKKRGTILIDYLTSTNSKPNDFLETHIYEKRDKYNPFNTLLGDLFANAIFYYGTATKEKPILLDESKFYALGNGVLSSDWKKQNLGKQLLQQVILKSKTKDELIQNIFEEVLDNNEKESEELLPKTGVAKDWELYLSSIFVTTDSVKNYGTRAQTILLVDQNNFLTFIERNLNLPSLDLHNISKETNVAHQLNQVISEKVTTKHGNWIQVTYEMQLEKSN